MDMNESICILITKPPHTTEGGKRVCGIARRARDKGMKVSIYLIGDGVLFAKKNLESNRVISPDESISIKVGMNDMLARGITPEMLDYRIEAVDDIEGIFVEDAMENSKLVFTW
ncbi:MAG TPA: DsrH/TusB family sulfur metabolism protein [Candidatus Methanofastidiosa archaeon]|nr:DsrH/TusB family sulfur metabolism protein [Candidatus Methanofastidiosa archaeon]HPR41677.1 DsrH/TusB family sulfur metabolism protein [Candidatus Methanofastidiosa archaeon]